MVVVVTVIVAFSTDQSYVNRLNTKKADRKKEDRKRKEQESAEAFSGLKIDKLIKISHIYKYLR